MTRLSILFAIIAFSCAGVQVFKQVTTGQADGPFTAFILMALSTAFTMSALLFQRISRLEKATKQKPSASEDS